MGWLLGCFKCRRRRPTSSSINLAPRGKDGRRVSSTALFRSANSARATESIEVGKFLSGQGDESKRNSSACIKTDRRSRSARRPSSEQLLQVEKLEEEINNLDRKLVEEATHATSLVNEVRHLRNCSALLDSPNAFRKALNALEQALEKGYVEESQPLLYLQSLLSKIEPSEEAVETSDKRDDERQANSFPECIDVSSSTTKTDQKSSGKPDDQAIQAEPDKSQGNIFTSVAVPMEPHQGQRLMPNDEQGISNTRHQHVSAVMDQDASKTEIISIVKRRSSKTLSFSGFLLVEGVTEVRPVADNSAAGEQCSSTEFSVTKIIEKTDLSGENLVEVSKSLFAFSTDNSQVHSTLDAEALFGNLSKEFSFSISDSEADSGSEMPEGNGSFSNMNYSSPSWLWSPQDGNTHDVDTACCSLSTGECQIDDGIETSQLGFSDADELSLLSAVCSNGIDHASSICRDSEEVDSQHVTKASQIHERSVQDNVSAQDKVDSQATAQALGMPQSEGIGDAMAGSCCNARSTEVRAGSVTSSIHTSGDLCQRCAASVYTSSGSIAEEADSGVIKHCFESVISEREMGNMRQFSILGDETSVELSSPATTSFWSYDTRTLPYDTQTSPYAVHTHSALRPVGAIKGGPSGFFSETPSTPVSVNSHESRLQLAKADANTPEFTPLSTPLTSNTQEAETPSTIRSQSSPSSLGEDRPILGTVAAHWNPSSTSSTQKWWDGKGIPNSTNKYKEDQKVSWHATPFEVRLERALAKQGRVFQKNLFPGAMATEMEVST